MFFGNLKKKRKMRNLEQCRVQGLYDRSSARSAVSGPATWNSLPVELRTSTFVKRLKSHLFGC